MKILDKSIKYHAEKIMDFEHPTQRGTHFIVSFIDIKYNKIVQYILPILNNLPNGVIHYNDS